MLAFSISLEQVGGVWDREEGCMQIPQEGA